MGEGVDEAAQAAGLAFLVGGRRRYVWVVWAVTHTQTGRVRRENEGASPSRIPDLHEAHVPRGKMLIRAGPVAGPKISFARALVPFSVATAGDEKKSLSKATPLLSPDLADSLLPPARSLFPRSCLLVPGVCAHLSLPCLPASLSPARARSHKRNVTPRFSTR